LMLIPKETSENNKLRAENYSMPLSKKRWSAKKLMSEEHDSIHVKYSLTTTKQAQMWYSDLVVR
jgi:hypothetical protein